LKKILKFIEALLFTALLEYSDRPAWLWSILHISLIQSKKKGNLTVITIGRVFDSGSHDDRVLDSAALV